MHLSRAKCTSRRAQDRSAPPPRTASARTAPRRPGPRTTTPGEKAQWDGVSNVVTRPICLDHLRSVGPPGSRNTVVQPHTSGPSRRAPLRARRRPRDPHPHHLPLNNLPDRRGPSPRAARTIRASRASISSSRPMRAREDFPEPGAYGSSAAYSPSPGRSELNARGVRIQRDLHATDCNGVGRFPPDPPVPDVPGCAPPAVNPGGPESDRRPRGRAAMCAGTAGTRPAGDPPCADTGLTVTLRHLLG